MNGKYLKFGSNVALSTAIFLGFLTLANYFSAHYYKRWDITRQERFTLSAQTISLMKSLQSGLKVTAFVKDSEPKRENPKRVLEQYEYLSGSFSWEFVDPDKRPAEAAKYNVTRYDTFIIESGGKKEEISGRLTEEALTNAILKVTSDTRKTIYFTEGHGERGLDDTGPRGYDSLRRSLENETFSVKSIALFGHEAVPDDAAALIIAGPEKDLFEDELAKIREYLAGGGKAFFLVDPFTIDATAAFIGEYGLTLRNDIVVDKMGSVLGGDVLAATIATYAIHPSTEGFSEACIFPLSRSIELSGGNENYDLIPLGLSLPNAWGETDHKALSEGKAGFSEGEDIAGPLALISIAVQKRSDAGKGEGILAVAGDADFVANSYFRLGGNRDFFMNIVSWMTGDEERIAIRPKLADMDPLMFTETQVLAIAAVSILLIPSLPLVAGIWVNVRRKRS